MAGSSPFTEVRGSWLLQGHGVLRGSTRASPLQQRQPPSLRPSAPPTPPAPPAPPPPAHPTRGDAGLGLVAWLRPVSHLMRRALASMSQNESTGAASLFKSMGTASHQMHHALRSSAS